MEEETCLQQRIKDKIGRRMQEGRERFLFVLKYSQNILVHHHKTNKINKTNKTNKTNLLEQDICHKAQIEEAEDLLTSHLILKAKTEHSTEASLPSSPTLSPTLSPPLSITHTTNDRLPNTPGNNKSPLEQHLQNEARTKTRE